MSGYTVWMKDDEWIQKVKDTYRLIQKVMVKESNKVRTIMSGYRN